MKIFTIALLLLCSVAIFPQLKVTSIKKINLPATQEWNNPVFSPDEKKIFITTSSFDGIWEYTISNSRLRLITLDKGSGYNFSISSNGKKIAFRTSSYKSNPYGRIQEIKEVNLRSLDVRIIAESGELSTPVYAKTILLYTKDYILNNAASKVSQRSIKVLGIENTKILLLRDGRKELFDPLGDGSYIWPSLSPDGTKILAADMSRGVYIFDLSGKIISKLGKRDAPVFSRDGKYIFYMEDKDDGQKITESDIKAVSIDGSITISLTNTNRIFEMFPCASMKKNMILCGSESGEIFIIQYREEKE